MWREKVQILTQTKMKPRCEMLTQWGHHLQLESALSWPDAMVSGRNNTELKDQLLGKSVWLLLWVSTLAQRLGNEGLDGAMLALSWSTNWKSASLEEPKQEKLSFERTRFRAQLNIFTTWYKYFTPSFAKHCFQNTLHRLWIGFWLACFFYKFDHIFVDANAAVALPGVELI